MGYEWGGTKYKIKKIFKGSDFWFKFQFPLSNNDYGFH